MERTLAKRFQYNDLDDREGGVFRIPILSDSEVIKALSVIRLMVLQYSCMSMNTSIAICFPFRAQHFLSTDAFLSFF